MRVLLATLAAAGLALSSPAVLAQNTSTLDSDMSFTAVDTDRNGAVSWAEFNLIFEDEYTEEQFRQADLDGDGVLNADEFDSLVIATGGIARTPRAAPALPTEEMNRSLTWTDPDDDT